MEPSLGRINIAASAQRREVDNRFSLSTYYRIADNLLKQAEIFRDEKNVIDLFVMLLRFSSLVSETIPRHRDYRASSEIRKRLLKKQLLNALKELEVLKPAVIQKLEELSRKHTYQVNGRNHMTTNESHLEWPPNQNLPSTNNLSAKVSGPAKYGTSKTQQWRVGPVEQFHKSSLRIPRPKEETLSKHSILGPNGLHGQWQPPVSIKGVSYPSNIDLTPIEFSRPQLAANDAPTIREDLDNVESKKSSLEFIPERNDDSLTPCANEPGSMISFETNDTCTEVIFRQPSPPPVLAGVQDLIAETPPKVSEMQDAIDLPISDDLVAPETPMELHISTTMMDAFLRVANSNTAKNLETCGVLAGSLKNRKFCVTALIIPKQEATENSCQTTNEEEIFEVQDKQSLFPLGWIHTHPTQSCFMSSVDLHTHYSYQIMLPEAVAIVMAPRDSSKKHGIFRLTTPGGMSVIRHCDLRGFHPHEPPADGGPIYQQCTDVYMNPNLKFDVIDLR